MNSLELKIPPPIVVLSIALLMWLAALIMQPPEIALGLRVGFALAFAFIGVAISASGTVAFRRAKTTMNPLTPSAASSLVHSGIYRFTRNPMYLGFLMLLLAWASYWASPLAFLFAPLFVLYMNRFQIVPEERALSLLFGAEYAHYKSTVRRWL